MTTSPRPREEKEHPLSTVSTPAQRTNERTSPEATRLYTPGHCFSSDAYHVPPRPSQRPPRLVPVTSQGQGHPPSDCWRKDTYPTATAATQICKVQGWSFVMSEPKHGRTHIPLPSYKLGSLNARRGQPFRLGRRKWYLFTRTTPQPDTTRSGTRPRAAWRESRTSRRLQQLQGWPRPDAPPARTARRASCAGSSPDWPWPGEAPAASTPPLDRPCPPHSRALWLSPAA